MKENVETFESFFRIEYHGIIPDLLSVKSVMGQFIHHQYISFRSVKCGKFG